jgi:hypothetical protein
MSHMQYCRAVLQGTCSTACIRHIDRHRLLCCVLSQVAAATFVANVAQPKLFTLPTSFTGLARIEWVRLAQLFCLSILLQSPASRFGCSAHLLAASLDQATAAPSVLQGHAASAGMSLEQEPRPAPH